MFLNVLDSHEFAIWIQVSITQVYKNKGFNLMNHQAVIGSW